MAGSTSSGPANRARGGGVPTRFRCKVGGEWKPLSAFSNKQQRLVQGQMGRDAPINAAHTGMTCRDHSGAPRTELKCEVCNESKLLSEFSKNSRRNGEQTCKRCCAWSETQEPEVTPAPLQTGHISVEESGKEVWATDYMESNDFFSDDMPQAPITELSSLGLEGQEMVSQLMAASSHGRASSVVSAASSLPPHLRARELRAGSSTGRAAPADARDTSPALGSEPVSMSMSTATSMRDAAVMARASENISFNAWDPAGKHHKGVKSPTLPSSTDQESVASRAQGSGLNRPSAPSQAPAQRTSRPLGRHNWAKPTRLSRAELQDTTGAPQFTVRHADANVDRQLRMQYHDSDDSDF